MTDSQHEAERLSDEQVRQWIEVVNHEPGRQFLRDALRNAARVEELEKVLKRPKLDPDLWELIGQATFLTDGEKRTLLGIDTLLNDINRKTTPEGK